MDGTGIGFNISGPVRKLGWSFRLEPNNSIVEPVLTELAVRSEGSSLECFLPRVTWYLRIPAVISAPPADTGALMTESEGGR